MPSALPPRVDPLAVLVPLRRAQALAGHCDKPEDGLRTHLAELERWAARLEDCATDVEVLAVMTGLTGKISTNRGKGTDWDGRKPTVTGLLAESQGALTATVEAAGNATLAHLGAMLCALTLESARERRREGRLRFHDLLVIARDLLPVPTPRCRALCSDKYRRLLIDEFQDTDPIQAELAVRIAVGAGAARRLGRRSRPPGRLFFVGDPKQSIYRFRRADVILFERVRQRLVAEAQPAHHQLPLGARRPRLGRRGRGAHLAR